MADWQNIETAPMDREILAVGPGGMAVVDGKLGRLLESAHGHYDGGGWTHWMPLPDAPA